MFLEFDKTCEKRITPTAITAREGFEQTKACYLQEVIPFFKTIKDNFEGIQKALTKEVKEMKYVFEELEAEVAQRAVDRKHEAIDLKNLLIANDNLIAECLSKEVFSVVTKFELNVARFTEMHVANTSIEARCLALEAELATVRDKSHQENQGELIKHFSKLETTDSQITKSTDHVTQLQEQNDMFRAKNDKIKQHYKELYESIKITRAKHIKQVTKLTAKNVMLKTGVSKAKVQPPVLTRTKHAVDVESIVPRLRNNRDAHLDYLRHLKESVETIHNIIEEAKVVRPLDRSIVSACRYTKHSQELLEYAIGTYPQGSQQRAKQLAHTPLIRKKQVTATKPSDRQDSCSKHMTGDRSRLLNFVKKFTGTVPFGNDHFGAIMGYGYYVVGESVISR
nr:integrase, catalytic region, zinc finger, CCHC-type, peptidase aspartic, catalytic [Tanacetum cinerariifolium]